MSDLRESAPEDFVDAYIEAALWSSTDDEEEPLDDGGYELAEETAAAMRRDCDTFYRENAATIEEATCSRGSGDYSKEAQAGHDFWLTRNGHGCGFWDGDWSEPHGDTLTAASKKFRTFDLYVGDDGKVHGQ